MKSRFSLILPRVWGKQVEWAAQDPQDLTTTSGFIWFLYHNDISPEESFDCFTKKGRKHIILVILKRVGFKSAVAGSGHFLERQTLGHHPRTTESQILGVGWLSCPLSARTTAPDCVIHSSCITKVSTIASGCWLAVYIYLSEDHFPLFFFFLILSINFIEGQLLYRISLFSAKYQHESAIVIPLPLEPPSHLPYHPTPLLFFKLILHCILLVK